jgi:hypothetical protein
MWPAVIAGLLPLLDKLIPDPQAANSAKMEALRLAASGQLAELDASMQVALAQANINQVEAAQDVFRGGWRPFCGWVCGAGLAYTFLARPMLPWFAQVLGFDVPPMPDIDTDTLMLLLTGMLGLGGLRTFERVRGKA